MSKSGARNCRCLLEKVNLLKAGHDDSITLRAYWLKLKFEPLSSSAHETFETCE